MRTPRVGIVGAGMSGIGMACKLRMAGIESFHIYEKWDGIGGTWHANRYPGLHCDVPSRNYEYTFAPNPDWSHVFSPGPEIHAYINRVARDFGLLDRISLSTPVADATWDEARNVWTLTTEAGDVAEYDFLISAVGGLVHTVKPDIPGLDDFAGDCFHSAEWKPGVTGAGQRVAVIGTGSTGMQITKGLAGVARHYQLYQRTPQWIYPVANRRYTRLGKWLMRRFPALTPIASRGWQLAIEGTFGTAVVQDGWQRRLITRACENHLKKIKDPDLRRRFTPTDRPMCKRLIAGTGFYELFERPDVELIDTGIDHIEARGIVTKDGVLHEQDVIVYATGFNAHAFMLPMHIHGVGGRDIWEEWEAKEPYAYRSIALPGYPNLFTLIGPHSPFGNQSLFTISETQADFAMRCIERWRRGEFEAMSPTPEATERFNAEMREQMPNTIWTTGCQSWYIGKDGLPHAWPWKASHHREVLQEPEPADWVMTTA